MSSQRASTMSRNLILKLVSLILGYSVWSMINQTQIEKLDLDIPVCMYNMPAHYAVQAPETIKVRLQASRATLRSLDQKQLALHIDGAHLHAGTNPLNVSQQALFLPENVNVVHYNATPLMITLTEKNDAPLLATHDAVKTEQSA